MEKKKFLECGKIINTHGYRGAVKLESWCNTPEDLAALSRLFLKEEDGMRCIAVKRTSIFKQYLDPEYCCTRGYDPRI